MVGQIILKDYPESIVADSLIIVRREGQNVATVNVEERRVDCQDEYTRMRLYGVIDQYMGNYNDQIEEEQPEEQA